MSNMLPCSPCARHIFPYVQEIQGLSLVFLEGTIEDWHFMDTHLQEKPYKMSVDVIHPDRN